ncbi:hypothetical protein AAFC00_003925 [Neodothiora populina]|uniref:Uncharacterized protein n=1 Tax=Neodothiora populina TaxID=2781224 RepID=A0ABR3PFU5_9PEZI
MSVTVTENQTTYAFARTLADYDIHHSAEVEDATHDLNPRAAPTGTGNNPETWESGYRRVPDHRPIDYDLDVQYRSVYQNNIERAFLWNMFNGIRVVSVSSMLTSPVLQLAATAV